MTHITRIGFCIVCLVATGMWIGEETHAQRGRGGGGRGGGGISRGGGGISRPSAGRSPSMSRPSVSRPSTRPSPSRPTISRPSTGLPSSSRPSTGRPATGLPSTGRPSTGLPSGGRPSTRPSQGQLNNFLNLDRPGSRPGTRPGGGAAGDFLQNRPAQLPSTGQRPGTGTPGNRPGGGNNIGNDVNINIGNRPNVGNNVGNRPVNLPANRLPGAGHGPGHRPPGTRPPGYRPPGTRPPDYRPPGYRPPYHGHLPRYGAGYWGRQAAYHWGWHNHAHNWWKWATAATVTRWVVRGFGQPIYYSYGDNIYYEGDNVYYNNEVVATTDEYAEQAQTIASNVPDVAPDKVEWMSLGVFALTQKDDDSVEDSTLFLQLAISKEGIIAGTFQNTATDQSFEVQGTIDTKSQRAAWGPVGEDWPIMETGIYNLSENQAGALLHFADGQTQEWSMVRLDEPAETDQNQ
ncbi:MAG TPA: hypothetical protein EYQ63_16835 [Fuerstia sp.]|nr:hypothetical protein [Fuerstiella sp.]